MDCRLLTHQQRPQPRSYLTNNRRDENQPGNHRWTVAPWIDGLTKHTFEQRSYDCLQSVEDRANRKHRVGNR
jgi:hypothetical protein